MAASPHESLESLRVHDHAVLFHRSEKERVETLVPFLRIGLARREKCLLHCGKATAEAIFSCARAGGIDIGGALARGAVLVAHSAAPGESKASPFDPEALVSSFRSAALQARTERYSALRICLDVAHALAGERKRDRILEWQGRLHGFLASHDALSLCMHDVGKLPPGILLDALRCHPHVVRDGRRIENFYFSRPSADPREMTEAREFALRLEHLVERQERIARIRRQAARLRRFRDIASSLLAHAAVPDVMDAIVEGVISLGHRMCWIGMARPDGTVEVAASWGDEMGYLREIQVRWDDTPLGNGPVGCAIRKGKPDVIRDVARSPRFAPWRENALARNFLSVAAVPLTAEGRTVGALAVYSPARNAFDKEDIEELSAFAVQVSLVLQYGKEYRNLALSEERFRTVVEEINVLVVELDPEGRIVLFNPAAELLTGYAAAEVLGKDCFGLLVPEAARERAREVFQEVLGGREVEGYESPVLRKDGTERIVSWNTKAIRAGNGDGEPRAVVGLGIDVTERLRKDPGPARKT
jgi:PAS domain S-box-containing protein